MRDRLEDLIHRLGYRQTLIGVMALDEAPPVPELTPGVRVAPFSPEDLAPMRACGGLDVEAAPERLARGDRPWGLWKASMLVCYGWTSRRGTLVSGKLMLVPEADEAYLYGFFTPPHHRGKGYYPQLLGAICRTLAAEGTRRAWIAVRSHNLASRKGIERAGFRLAAGNTSFRGRLTLVANFRRTPDPALRPLRRGLHGRI